MLDAEVWRAWSVQWTTVHTDTELFRWIPVVRSLPPNFRPIEGSRDALVFCSGLQRGTREFELAARAPALGSCVDPVCLRLVITVPLNFGRIG
ncbi:hypothetical protein HPB48_012471 [Haemaphysalis longicornis]|uniref:Uncharacterized protein n=1 Tax=Haemaphysalis longicornis TaxID=44386 RepID=A0A9J6GIL5_HAELO|nr:hypothetical protein HPB48_012471 [Haemaphysalis longicornis]